MTFNTEILSLLHPYLTWRHTARLSSLYLVAVALFVYFALKFFYVYGCSAYIYVWCHQTLELELQMIVSHHVDVGIKPEPFGQAAYCSSLHICFLKLVQYIAFCHLSSLEIFSFTC